MTILLLIFLFQFLPKLYHSFCLMSKMRKVTGYIFGTVWWGFGINLIAYLITSHVIGGCWYVLATRSVASCFRQQCERSEHCNLSLSCSKACNPLSSSNELLKYSCDGNVTLLRNSICLDDSGPFEYGFYAEALPVISSNSLATRSLYPVFWGLLNLSSFGNELEPMSDSIQLIFCIFITLAGLSLFTLLVGNIQVYLQVVLARTENMQLRRKEIGWWMRRRQLPFNLRQRVRHYERHRWLFTGGQEEMEWIEELPEGLRRDIKRYLCIELIKKVPLFQQLDDLILDNICDRIKSFILSKDEKIIREGDPVQRMVFLVRGRVKRSQHLSKGMIATSIVEPGGFLGDELLSWCIRYPLIDQLPTASATFVCLESTEVFGLDANNLRYITRNFRYAFASQRLKRTTRYYSSNWRTWAVVIIQLAWRRYKKRTRDSVNPVTVDGGTEGRIRQYAAMFMSIRPHDHLE